MTRGIQRSLLAAAVVGMVAYCAVNLRIGTDVTNFLPAGGRSDLAALSRNLANSELTRTMALCIGADSADSAVAAAADLEKELRDHPEVAWIRSGTEASGFEQAFDLYFPRRFYFLSDRPEIEIPAMVSDQELRQRAADLKRSLLLPTSTLMKSVVARDPLGSFFSLVERLRGEEPALDTHQGHFITADGRYAVILLGTRHSPFASGAQARFLADLDHAFAGVAARADSAVSLEKSGANRIAVRAEEQIRGDVYLIAACSFFGVAALFLVFLRSLGGFLLAALPAQFGILFATTAGLFVLGNLDGLTLAFGAALIGVTIDYPIHVLNHHALAAPPEDARQTVARLRPSLLLGAATTMASFAGLLLTSSPGFREMGFLAIAGVAAALLVTLYVLPSFLPARRSVPALSRSIAAFLGRSLRGLEHRRRQLGILTLVVLVPALLAVPRLVWVDDLSRLGGVDPQLIEEDMRVRERVSQLETGRFVIALGDDAEAALALNDLVYEELQLLVASGDLGGARSLHQILWSTDLQSRNWQTLQGQEGLYRRVDSVFRESGFRPGAFAAFQKDLSSPPPPPLTLADLRASELGQMLATTAFELGESFAIVTFLRDIRSTDAVREAVDGLDGAFFFEQREFVNQIYGEFRATTLRQVLIGSVLVAVVLVLRYRDWRRSLAALLPSIMVVVALLGGFSLFGVETNLLHVISLMMVMGMGVDYGVFLVDTFAERRAFSATMLSLLLSCLTTVFVFGTLAISDHPALRAIGVTTGFGVLLAFVFAPLTLLLIGAADRGVDEDE